MRQTIVLSDYCPELVSPALVLGSQKTPRSAAGIDIDVGRQRSVSHSQNRFSADAITQPCALKRDEQRAARRR
jgi:hypothetical protein